MSRRARLAALLAIVAAGSAATYVIRRPPRMRPGPVFSKCMFASPQLLRVGGRETILVAVSDGTVAAIDPPTGEIVWRHVIEPPWAEAVWLLATPVIVEGKLVVAYQTYSLRTAGRTSHRVVVLDTESGLPDPGFPPLELAARAPAYDGAAVIEFDPTHALSRAALVHGRLDTASLGYVYVSFGNERSTQPFHGWVFELDLNAWRKEGAAAAISAALPTTRDPRCPDGPLPPSSLCGGGVWAPFGPKLHMTDGGFELLVPTGNGSLDLSRSEYATTVMRLEPGLHFDPGCDLQRCAGDGSTQPTPDCAASCENLFIPRLLPGDPPFKPVSGACDERDFSDCLTFLDLDFGSSPVRIELPDGRPVLVQAGKDGALYLIDAQHLGTLYDREQIVDLCGTAEKRCVLPWAGTIVTEPAVTEVNGMPVVIVPTFVPDRAHPAGVVAVKIAWRDGAPRFEPFWRAPDPTSPEALENFRLPPSGITLTTNRNGRQHAWVAEDFNLWAIDVRDGTVVERVPLDVRSIRFARPLAHDGRLYLPLCKADDRGSRLDSYSYLDIGS